MTTLVLTHPACLDHLTPPGHPERPDRLRAIDQVLAEDRFDRLVRGEAPEGTLDSVTLCHNEHYISELRHIAPTRGLIHVDADTSMSPGTWEAAMRGVGGAVAATDAVMAGTHNNAFVAVRPPGHHDTIVNAPLAPEDGSAKFRAAFENVILPQLTKFSPELIIVSAGFDAHFRDPLASINLKADDFGWVTRKLMDVADASAEGRIVSVLEGGYDLQGLKESVAAHLTALMGG